MAKAVTIPFTDHDRDFLGPASETEPMIEYINRSGREGAKTARETINKWIGEIPEPKFRDLISSLQSTDDATHLSAFFELFLYQFFQRTGCRVLSYEESIDGIEGTPDFLIENPTDGLMVVEAISPSLKSQKQKAIDNLEKEVKSAINSIKCPNHYLLLEPIKVPHRSFPKKPLIDAIQNWIDGDPETGEFIECSDGGLYVKLEAIRCKPRDVEAINYRAVGVEHFGVTMSTPGDDMKSATEKKAKKYRDTPFPYIIAVNARGFHDTEDDYISALYGTLAARYFIGEGAPEPEMIRQTDGLFNDGGNVRKSHVSGVLFFNGIAPWDWQKSRACMIHNAFADRKIFSVDFQSDCFAPVSLNELQKWGGKSVDEIFST
ncbi:hypothetical protein WJT74_11200 [Sphingomicrobium sp. XHP0239]|uniref:hypothetical protein n=1 Tax=Sphingomicrobium maritimum TaxID=3133972 RepID=UPI0031CCB170